MQQWWIGAATAAAAGIGYLVKRWIERRRPSEALTRRLKALELLRGMKREGVSMAELEQIERQARE